MQLGRWSCVKGRGKGNGGKYPCHGNVEEPVVAKNRYIQNITANTWCVEPAGAGKRCSIKHEHTHQALHQTGPEEGKKKNKTRKHKILNSTDKMQKRQKDTRKTDGSCKSKAKFKNKNKETKTRTAATTKSAIMVPLPRD